MEKCEICGCTNGHGYVSIPYWDSSGQKTEIRNCVDVRDNEELLAFLPTLKSRVSSEVS